MDLAVDGGVLMTLDDLLTVLYTTHWALLPPELYVRWIGDLWKAIGEQP